MTDASGNSLAAGKEETRADCNKLPGPNRNGCGLLQARPAAQGLTQGSLRSPLARAGQGQERPPPHLPWLHPSPSLPVVTSGASRSRPGSSPSPASPVGVLLLITCSALNRCSAGCSCVEAPGRPQGRAAVTPSFQDCRWHPNKKGAAAAAPPVTTPMRCDRSCDQAATAATLAGTGTSCRSLAFTLICT